MVRQNDQMIFAFGLGGGSFDAGEVAVELGEHIKGVVVLDAGVVSELIVCDVGGVKNIDLAGEDVPDHGLGGDVAHKHGGESAHQRVGAAPRKSGPDVVFARPTARADLENDVPDKKQQRMDKIVGARKVSVKRRAVELIGVFDFAEGKNYIFCVTGKKIVAAGPVDREQSFAVAVPLFDQRRIGGT